MPKRFLKPPRCSPDRRRRREPAWRRVVVARMWRAQTIAIGFAGAFGAMMFGVTLGNSAISQINPIHFQGAAVHPRDRGAAVDPNRPLVIPNNYEQLYGWSHGVQARTAACPGCTFERPVAPTDVRVASASYFGSREEGARRDSRERREIDQAYDQRQEDAERRRQLTSLARYTDYPVSQDEVARERPESEGDVWVAEDGDTYRQ